MSIVIRAACVLVGLALGGCNKRAQEHTVVNTQAAPQNPGQVAQGSWCLRSMTNGTSPAVLDGATWELNPDGTYVWTGELTTRGTWSITPQQLTLSHGGDYEVVKLSAEHMVMRRMGVDFQLHRDCGPEIAAARQVSALRNAAAKGDVPMVEALINQKGVDVNMADPFHVLQHTPLMAAIEEGHVHVVSRLLRHGATVTALSGSDDSVFDKARKTGNPEITRILMAELKMPDSLNVPALLKKADAEPCPKDYLEKSFTCVHSYALPRPTLRADIAAFAQGQPSPQLELLELPALAKPRSLPELTPVAEALDFSDPSKLDPAALMRKGGSRRSSSSSKLPSATKTKSAPTARAPAPAPAQAKRNDNYADPNWKYQASAEEKKWAAQYTRADGEFDREKFKQQLCAQYEPALERLQNGEMDSSLKTLGMSRADGIKAVQANIRACSQ